MFDNLDLTKLIFGRLTWDAIPLHDPILLATFIAVAIGGTAVLGALTYFKLWGYLWNEWFTSIDHKKIGNMYIILGLVKLMRGFTDALMMRAQQALSFGESNGFLPPHHYDQIFTAHGVIMIFFVAMPFVTGLMNYVLPLQIGARDVAFPFLNNFSFWMTAGGAGLTMISLFVGAFSSTGWLAYPHCLAFFIVRPGGRLLYLVVTSCRSRHVIVRHQLAGNDHQNARSRHGADEDAYFCLDGTVHQCADCHGLPCIDCSAWVTVDGPVCRHQLFHK